MFPIVIPHHNRHDLLKTCLESIPKGYPVYIISGGTFAENCNKGFQLVKEEAVFFLNDDTIVNALALSEAEKRLEKADIIGINQVSQDGSPLFIGVRVQGSSYWPFTLVKKKELADFPSGAAFLIKTKLFKELNGFNERFKNGAEDVDLFLRAIELKAKIDYTNASITHFLSQSDGRWEFTDQNVSIFWTYFKPQRLEILFPDRDIGLS